MRLFQAPICHCLVNLQQWLNHTKVHNVDKFIDKIKLYFHEKRLSFNTFDKGLTNLEFVDLEDKVVIFIDLHCYEELVGVNSFSKHFDYYGA